MRRSVESATDELRRRSGGVRPLHGQVLVSARTAVRRLRPRVGRADRLDVGCGPGALTEELVRRVGAAAVTAVDPSESFVSALEERHPGVTVRLAPAEELPFAESSFDAALAQLVVHFMRDPVAGLREMARVTHEGGVIAASVWDHGGGHGPLSVYWDVVARVRSGRSRRVLTSQARARAT